MAIGQDHLAEVIPYALVGSVGAEDDGAMGEHNEDQDDVVEPTRPLLTTTQAREVTAGLREATTSGAP
ncbi:hypothetical protein [Streptomyces sp. NBC_00342]|uniref:hypothetical protein n=1 Tax=Streptomyces sp. NBC_00342 TaxID=2975718 RepID=UPI002E2A54AF|nr:hypothetical protein [Streptomyces sp. NBC_00342]